MSDSTIKEQEHIPSNGISRRAFMRNLGLTSVGAATASSGVLEKLHAAMPKSSGKVYSALTQIMLNVNGRKLAVKVEPRSTLADVLRDYLHLTGTKVGCDRGACGACTVILDGKTITSCMTLAMDAIGAEIQTIEGLQAQDGTLHAIQASFIEHDALQCGFCTSGMLMSCKNLLDQNASPSLDEVKVATSGNLCRCGTYPKVFDAVLSANK
jgi:aerobic-type carbon monoxide dehydrogenase small subunit (CoxS/CutS family)